MDAGKRLLIEQAFDKVKAGRKELGASIGFVKTDEYLELLVRRGELARLFEEAVLKDG